MADLKRLEELCRVGRALVVVRSFEEAEVLQLVRDAAMGLDRSLRIWTVLSGVYDGILSQPESVPDTTDPVKGLTALSHNDDARMVCLVDVAEHLDDARVLRALRDLVSAMRSRNGTVVMLDHSARLPEVVEAHATRFEPSLPGREELESIVRSTVQRVHRASPIAVDLRREHLDAIVRNLRGLTRRQAEEVVREVAAVDRRLDESDIDDIVDLKRELIRAGGLLEFVRAPTSMEQIGGLDRLKSWLRSREGALDSAGLDTPRGVLLLGVQGAGKSLCAKAIATAWRRPLMRMDVGALYDKYVGESERRLRDTLHQTEMMSPVILWIDEIEKAFASAGGHSNDGGLSRRMFGTLLTWMQEHRAPVFLVATANDIEALPPELLRKGRFDEIFFVDLPGEEARAAIFRIHLGKRELDPGSFDMPRLVEASAGFSGAEIEQAIIAARHEARATGSGTGQALGTDGLVRVLGESPPLSVTMAEKVAELRAWSRGRCVPAE
ncbi:MAG: AAA family ATPase [Planctomycetota bacterium]